MLLDKENAAGTFSRADRERLLVLRNRERFQELKTAMNIAVGKIGSAMYLGYWAIDIFYAPKHKYLFLALRILVAIQSLLTTKLVNSSKRIEVAESLILLLNFSSSLGIAIMATIVQPGSSVYITGIILCTFGYTSVLPVSVNIVPLFVFTAALPYLLLTYIFSRDGLPIEYYIYAVLFTSFGIGMYLIRWLYEETQMQELQSRLNLKEEVARRRDAEQRTERIAMSVAHDLKSPTSALALALKAEGRVLSPAAQQMMSESIERIRLIAMDLLRRGAERVNLNANQQLTHVLDVVASVMEELRLRFPSADVSLIAPRTEGALRATISAPDLRRVLSNISNNAAEATNGRGVVIFSISRELKEIAINVADDGPGIPSNILNKIGTTFVQTSKLDGSGYGFMSARHLVEQAGGKLLIKRSDSAGTEVEVRLIAD